MNIFTVGQNKFYSVTRKFNRLTTRLAYIGQTCTNSNSTSSNPPFTKFWYVLNPLSGKLIIDNDSLLFFFILDQVLLNIKHTY